MEELKIGYAREDFTPDKPIRMNSTTVSTQVNEPICVTCMSFSDGKQRVLLVAMDLRNAYKRFTGVALPLIMEATGLAEEEIIFAVSHNHSCPDVSYVNDESVVDWRDRIAVPAMVRAAKAAVADEKKVTQLFGGKSEAENVGYVRRYLRADGTWTSIASANPSKAPRVAHESKADPELRAVRIKRDGGKDLVMINYQIHTAHAASKNKGAITADFVHFLREKLEQTEDVQMVFLQGCCGNINTFTKLEEEIPLAQKNYWDVGEAVFQAAREALVDMQELKMGSVQLRSGTLDCAVNHQKDHLVKKIEELRAEKDPEKYKQLLQQNGIASRYEAAAINRRAAMPEFIPMELAAFSFGDVALAFNPLEMFDTNGIQLRNASPFPMTLSCGYALNYYSYVPSMEAWPHGEYEVLQCHFHPGTGEKVILENLAQLRDMKNA